MFVSKTNRFNIQNPKVKRKQPAVGEYDTNQFTIQTQLEKKLDKSWQMPFVEWKDILIPFNSSTLWFDGTKVDENAKYLGPGYYEIPPAIGPKQSPSKAKPWKVVENFNTT